MIFKWHSYSTVSKLPFYRRLIRPYSTIPAISWPDDAKSVRLGLVQYLLVRLGLVQYPWVRTLSYFKPTCSRFSADFRYGGTCGNGVGTECATVLDAQTFSNCVTSFSFSTFSMKDIRIVQNTKIIILFYWTCERSERYPTF